MRIRLRGPSGAATATLGEDATVGDLISQITEKTSVTSFDVKYGYPPKPLDLDQKSVLLTELDVRLDGEQLTISPIDSPAAAVRGPTGSGALNSQESLRHSTLKKAATDTPKSFSFTNIPGSSSQPFDNQKSSGPVSLQRKAMEEDVPELPLPDRGATLVLRVMPDDNSCLFRAFGTAVLPGDDLSMTELRSLAASAIQNEPEVYTKVILEQKPDDYCRWIQTEDAWGGAIEMGILSKHFDIEICSIDVQSLRVDKFNEGRPARCILVYSGIHYDTIVQSPSDPPHLKADNPPELDKRVWEADDNDILIKAQELCEKLQAKHYYTDTGGMAIKCNECGWIGYGEKQAAGHAQQTNHYDMAEMN